MTTISEGQITRRKVHIQSNFERTAFMFMRLSGIALLVLAVGHMMLQHVLNSSTNLTIQFVAEQWRSYGWKIFDILLLAFAIPHGVNGLRNILEDYVHSETAMKWINILLLVFVVATLLWAGYAIWRFDSTPFSSAA
ncbi:MAG: succinate dehydrogenase, hydrophobic membrane anchor protein [Candidatus Promineifilaceae bacterium]|jgi:succinate dehydrogenase membrane anchor subunit